MQHCSVTGKEVLTKVKQLCHSHGFMYEVFNHHGQSTGYSFGPAGVLLRRSILHEWYQALVATQENTYQVDDSPLTAVPDLSPGDQDSSAADSSHAQYQLRSSLSDGCLCHYLRLLELNSQRFPFSVVQSGLCRNTKPSQTFLLGCTEQTGLLLQHFSAPSLATQSYDNWQRSRLKWWRQFSQNPSNFSLSDVKSDCGWVMTDIQYDFPWGKDTVEMVCNRGDLSLREMEAQTGLSHQGKHGRKSVFPAVIECNTSLEQAMLAFIVDAFTEKERTSSRDKHKGLRTVLRINRHLAPYKVAIAISGPGARELREVANQVARDLRHAGMTVFDAISDSPNSLESRLSRFDEVGIPFSVILNVTTLKDGIVGVRNRDTTLKEQVHISRLRDTIWRNIMKS